MSFDAVEISNYDAIPSLLYEFALGTVSWRYCSNAGNLTVGGHVYTGTAISDSGIIQSGDVQNDDFTITMPADLEFTTLFLGTPPSEKIGVIIRRKNRGETEAPIVWVGEVKSTKRTGIDSLDVICKTSTASLNRNGLRLSWGRNCPHALYDLNCRVDKADFALAVEISALSGELITSTGIASQPSGYWAGGFIEWEILPDVMERRAVETHEDDTIILIGTTDGLEVGMWISVYPGCNRTTAECIDKFDNLPNYGGFPGLPGKSPFDGGPVF